MHMNMYCKPDGNSHLPSSYPDPLTHSVGKAALPPNHSLCLSLSSTSRISRRNKMNSVVDELERDLVVSELVHRKHRLRMCQDTLFHNGCIGHYLQQSHNPYQYTELEHESSVE